MGCDSSLVAKAVLQLTMELKLALNSNPAAFTSQVLGLQVCTTMLGFYSDLIEWHLPPGWYLMMATKNIVVLLSPAKMGTRKKVQAFVRVRPTDDFAHEMIKYGEDNKVSAVCLTLFMQTFPFHTAI